MKQYGSSVLRLRNLSVCVVILLSSIFAAAQHETILHSFGTSTNDGTLPSSSLIADASGNLYGTAQLGGGQQDGGTIFQLSPASGGSWTESSIYIFTAGDDGGGPNGTLVFDKLGNLYGTTDYAGDPVCQCGTVFELSPPANPGGSWTFTTLYRFVGGDDGLRPEAGVVFDTAGNLYGTTGYGGGKGTCGVPLGFTGCGTIFELSPSSPGGAWTEVILYAFSGGNDGGIPVSPITIDKSGNLFGTTGAGGTVACEFANCGTVYELALTANDWKETVLHDFGSFRGDAVSPALAGLFLDKSGAFVGTTPSGGIYGGGTVFGLLPPTELGKKWTYGVVYSFGKPLTKGYVPEGGVIVVNGLLYGTASVGGDDAGTVFQLTRTAGGIWRELKFYAFTGSPDGMSPQAGLLFHDGAFYGTTAGGGTANLGTVFRITP